jgi:hypothetical protein
MYGTHRRERATSGNKGMLVSVWAFGTGTILPFYLVVRVHNEKSRQKRPVPSKVGKLQCLTCTFKAKYSNVLEPLAGYRTFPPVGPIYFLDTDIKNGDDIIPDKNTGV